MSVYALNFDQVTEDGGKALRQLLADYGVAVVNGVISRQEAEATSDAMDEWIKGAHPTFDPSNPATWNLAAKMTYVHRIAKFYSVGQAQFMWDMRTHPRVQKLYSLIWERPVSELRTGYDGCCIMPPPEQLGPRTKSFDHHDKGWIHRDQALNDDKKNGIVANKLDVIQGLVNIVDATADDGTFICVPGTHTWTDMLKEWWRARKVGNKLPVQGTMKTEAAAWRPHWCRIEAEDLATAASHEFNRVRVPIDAGSMIFWDSRTWHSNCYPKQGRPNPVWRKAVYVCQFPREKYSDENRRKLFIDRATTDHRGLKSNGKHRFEKDQYETPPPVMCPAGWSLIDGSAGPFEGAQPGVHYVVDDESASISSGEEEVIDEGHAPVIIELKSEYFPEYRRQIVERDNNGVITVTIESDSHSRTIDTGMTEADINWLAKVHPEWTEVYETILNPDPGHHPVESIENTVQAFKYLKGIEANVPPQVWETVQSMCGAVDDGDSDGWVGRLMEMIDQGVEMCRQDGTPSDEYGWKLTDDELGDVYEAWCDVMF